MQMTIAKAAQRLGVHTDTIRRRIGRGELTASRDSRSRWMVEIDDQEHVDGRGEVRRLEELVATLRDELEARRREVQELHHLLAQAQAALPAPRLPWWRRLLGQP